MKLSLIFALALFTLQLPASAQINRTSGDRISELGTFTASSNTPAFRFLLRYRFLVYNIRLWISPQMNELTDYSRIFAITDEMHHAEQNPALDAKALRARIRHYRAQINREIGAIIAANAKIE